MSNSQGQTAFRLKKSFSLFSLKQCIIKQSLIDSLSLIYGIINVEESVMSHNFTKCYEKDPKCKLVYSNIFLITEIECIIYDVHSMK